MSSPALETFLARLYTDRDRLDRFLADPAGEARRAGLSEVEAAALAEADLVGLAMAASSYEHKRQRRRS